MVINLSFFTAVQSISVGHYCPVSRHNNPITNSFYGYPILYDEPDEFIRRNNSDRNISVASTGGGGGGGEQLLFQCPVFLQNEEPRYRREVDLCGGVCPLTAELLHKAMNVSTAWSVQLDAFRGLATALLESAGARNHHHPITKSSSPYKRAIFRSWTKPISYQLGI